MIMGMVMGGYDFLCDELYSISHANVCLHGLNAGDSCQVDSSWSSWKGY